MRRVVITGLGLVTPLGLDVPTTWENIKAGKNGIDRITYFDTTNFNVKIAAEIRDFHPENYFDSRDIRRHSRYQHFIMLAVQQALTMSGITITPDNAFRSSSLVSSSTGGLKSYADYMHLIWETNDPRKMTPFAIPMLIVNAGNNVVAIRHGMQGPSGVIVSACATGADAIGYARDLIRAGRIDRAVAGCSDAPIIDMGIAVFDKMQVLSRRNHQPQVAMRPFDKDRDGMVFAEGCGVLALEELETAKSRGANILAELVGYGSTTDAFHRVAPLPDGKMAAAAINLAIEDAQITPEQLQYINAHGTSTRLNAPMETSAIKLAFGDHAYNLAISSTKSMTGHAMGATAAMEAAFTVLTIQDQIAPPTLNLDNPEEGCDLDFIPYYARPMPIQYAMSNSFGFGGHNTSLIFKRYDD